MYTQPSFDHVLSIPFLEKASGWAVYYLFFVINYWLQDGSFEAYYNNASKHIEEMRLQKGLSNA
jgi:hypothetical protein